MIDFCGTTARFWQLAGYVLYIIKVLIPLIIIILGAIDFAKALTSNKDDEINNATKKLIVRMVIGIVIFFIPLLISTIFGLIKNANPYLDKVDACQTCLLKPFNSACNAYKNNKPLPS